MAYTLCTQYGDPQPIRMITVNGDGEPEIKAEFTPSWWTCDPCNMPDKRFEVTYRTDSKPQYFHWYEIVTSDDDERTISCKLSYYREVLDARKALDEARAEFHRLTGSWS